MTKYWPAQLAVQALQEEGVEVMFGILGGHIQSIIDYGYRAGIKIIMTRHEQAAVHAADGYARLTRKPGVCFATGGPGTQATCFFSRRPSENSRLVSPVLVILGNT